MKNIGPLFSREIRSLIYSPLAYACGTLFMLLQGVVFWILLTAMNDPRFSATASVSQVFFGGTLFYWITVLILIPLLTMRTFSEEKRSGSIEFLLTAPVTEAEVVIAKFLGAWAFYCALWAVSLSLFGVLQFRIGLDWGAILCGYLGTCLLGGALIALGIFASNLTRNQLIAALLSFVMMLLLFSLSFFDVFIADQATSQFLQQLSLIEHLTNFARGFIDTRPIVFYGSLIAIFLFLTERLLTQPRWRS